MVKKTNTTENSRILGCTCLFVALIIKISEHKKDNTQDIIANATRFLENEKYVDARNELLLIKQDNPLFGQSKLLISKIDSIEQSQDSISIIVRLEKEKNERIYNDSLITETLKGTILLIDQNFDYSTLKTSLEELKAELLMFASYKVTIDEHINSSNVERNKLAKELKRKVEKLQAVEFPKMRSAFAKRMAERMWEEDIEVSVTGKKNSIIELTGGIFAANKNIKEAQQLLDDGFRQYRFRQARYRWYREADEYTYYEIYKGEDIDLVNFE